MTFEELKKVESMEKIESEREMIYLAVPYSPKVFGFSFSYKTNILLGPISWMIRVWRFRRVTKAAANLIKLGYNVFSPITHSHPIPLDKLDGALWLKQDFWFVKRADKIFVLDLLGRAGSNGVNTELVWGKKFSKPIYVIDIKGKIQKKL
jgi:hypothetical protein